MAEPKKTASGKWTIQVFSYKDADGKVHTKRFTADTKSEVKSLAKAYELNRDRLAKNDLTVQEAIRSYIAQRTPVLSPSTIAGYQGYAKTNFNMIDPVRINALTSEKVQNWINHMVEEGKTPKSIRNNYGLLRAALKLHRPGLLLDVVLPQKVQPKLYTPTDADIRYLLQASEGTELHKAILLAAFATLRRGEIAALEASDLEGNILTVSKSMVHDSTGRWIIKGPKTLGSYRSILLPDFVAEELRGCEGRLVDLNPAQITTYFDRMVDKCELPHIRFHDLRHYSASIMHAIGIPDQYIMQAGGWSSDSVMKRIYRNTMDDQTQKMSKKRNDYFRRVAKAK